MEVIWKYYDGLDSKRVAGSDIAKRDSKWIDSLRRPAVAQIDRKEEAPAGNEIASVSAHRKRISVV